MLPDSGPSYLIFPGSRNVDGGGPVVAPAGRDLMWFTGHAAMLAMARARQGGVVVSVDLIAPLFLWVTVVPVWYGCCFGGLSGSADEGSAHYKGRHYGHYGASLDLKSHYSDLSCQSSSTYLTGVYCVCNKHHHSNRIFRYTQAQ